MRIQHVPYGELRLADAQFQNPRQFSGLEEQEIRELAVLIGYHGLLNPLRVTQDNVILAGQRRYKAIGYLREHAVELAHQLEQDPGPWCDRIARLVAEVPVIYDTSIDKDGVAMADNLGRVDLSSYEVAAGISHMHERGDTGAEIAAKIGRSAGYVSKALKAWRASGDALKAAWRDGRVSYEQVKQLADLSEEEQERAISGDKPKAGYGRPGIDAVKDTIASASKRYEGRAADQSYAMGVLDALRWASGQTSSATFAEFMETLE